jgi:Glucodextranase, domain B
MKKETILSVVLGLTAGIGGGILVLATSKGAVQDQPPADGQQGVITITPAVTIESPQTDKLSIQSPLDKTIVTTDTITITGKAHPGSLITSFSAGGEKSLKAKEKTFSIEHPLIEGENTIIITSYDPNGTSEQSQIVVYLIKN